MKLTALFLICFMVWGLQNVKAEESTIEITQADKELVAERLDAEADSGKHDSKTKEFLHKVSNVFKTSQTTDEVAVDTKNEDCADCSKKQKTKNFFSKIGRKIGKGAAWLTTTTAKPFMTAAGFVTGAVEKGDKNQDIVALYKFFLNHQAEFDDLYLEAGTPEEMIELMLVKTEEIMEKKSALIMREFLLHLGLNKEIPADLSDFELSSEEIAQIDPSKIDVDFINNHPEYKELKPLIGEMSKNDLMDIITSGYFDKSISFENYKEALPKTHELIGTLVTQIFAPKIALGIVSSTLAGLYVAPVVAAQIGTGVSTVICMDKSTVEKFDSDKDLKQFCSYVTNRTAYLLMKSRAKGYVAGKGFHQKIADKIAERKARRAEKKRQKELARAQKEGLVPALQ